MSDDVIYRQEAIDALVKRTHLPWKDLKILNPMLEVLELLPSAEPEIAEKLYLYKCYITDEDGLQHEVIHTGDIRRVTGWMI